LQLAKSSWQLAKSSWQKAVGKKSVGKKQLAVGG